MRSSRQNYRHEANLTVPSVDESTRRGRQPETGAALAFGLLATAAAIGARAAGRRSRRRQIGGQTVIVTGGSRGLGLVLARQLARRGARVAICGRDESTLRRALEEHLRPISADVMAVQADVTRPDDVARFVAEVRDRFGPIDVLINNVATIQVGPAQLMTEADYRAALDPIFWASFRMTEAVLPDFHARGGGRIANIASVGGLIPAPHLAPYVIAKHALVGYSRAMHNELARDGVRVTTVNPGLMRTGSPRNVLVKGNAEAEYAWFKIADSLPITSMSAERAGRQIISAIEYGDAELTLTLSANVGARVQALFPNLSAHFGTLLNRLLPAPAGSPDRRVRGRDAESASTGSIATSMTDRAARRNNEMG